MRSEEILKDQILKYSVYQGLLPSAGWTNARSDRVVLVPTRRNVHLLTLKAIADALEMEVKDFV